MRLGERVKFQHGDFEIKISIGVSNKHVTCGSQINECRIAAKPIRAGGGHLSGAPGVVRAAPHTDVKRKSIVVGGRGQYCG